MGSWLERLLGPRGGDPSVEELAERIRAGAAFLSQGSSYSYIRARSGSHAAKLFADDAFVAALDRCKWEGFAAAAADLTLILERETRPHRSRTDDGAAFVDLYRRALALEPPPPIRGATGWSADVAAFALRLNAALRVAPGTIESIAQHTGDQLMAFAPVTPDIRESDAEMVQNNVKFRFIDFTDRLRREIDMTRLASRLDSAGAAE